MKLRLFFAAATAAALAFPASSLAAGRNVVVTVVLTDSGTKVGVYLNTQVADITSMAPLAGPLLKKDDLHFIVLNRGNKSHDFEVFGKSTGSIKPGGNKTFLTHAPGRGKFAYKTPSDQGKAFSGTFVVR
jgi:hypothetical protein